MLVEALHEVGAHVRVVFDHEHTALTSHIRVRVNTVHSKTADARHARRLPGAVIFGPCLPANVRRLEFFSPNHPPLGGLSCVHQARTKGQSRAFHADRASRGHQHHRPLGRSAPSRRPGPRVRRLAVPQCVQQPEADRASLCTTTRGSITRFPPGYVSKLQGRRHRPPAPAGGWAAMLLPQMEQKKPLFDTVKLQSAHRRPVQPDGADCRSSAPLSLPLRLHKAILVGDGAKSERHPRRQRICQLAPANYVGGLRERATPESTADGLSSSGDSKVGNPRRHRRHVPDDRGGREGRTASGEATWTGSVTDAVLFPVDDDGVGLSPRPRGGPGHGSLAMRAGDTVPGTRTERSTSFHSLHSGGVNFLFADGHVAFLKNHDEQQDVPLPSPREAGGEAILRGVLT